MAAMNQAHLEFLASPAWAQMLETDLLPWIERVADLGDDVLEIGPGPEDDTFNPLDETTFAGRLKAIGFVEVDVEVLDYELRFVARKPPAPVVTG